MVENNIKQSYLILVPTATTGGRVLFPAGVPFSTENTEGTVLKSLFREYNTQNTIYTKQKTKYANQKTKYAN